MAEGSVQRKEAAERGALLELAAILTHDLSNPLQSITVLCELGLDEEDLVEARRRNEQCLQAAERMRTLVHCYAGLVRNAQTRGPAALTLERLVPLLSRRFERHRITVQTEVHQDFVAPASFELAALVMLLGIVRSASARAGAGPCRVRLVIDHEALLASIGEVGGEPVGWAPGVVEDLQAIVADTQGEAHQEGPEIRLAFRGAA